jgi:hypothetical protein
MEAVAYCDDAIEPIHAVKSIRHRKHDDRQQKDQIEEDFAAGPSYGLPRLRVVITD